MSAWFSALAIAQFNLTDAWTTMTATHPATVTDENGAPQNVTPVTWLEVSKQGTAHPAAVTFEYGCGRVGYTSYITSVDGAEFSPQQKALFYMLFDVPVCIGP